jgi:Terpene synthase family 2, C-terminal metal binding
VRRVGMLEGYEALVAGLVDERVFEDQDDDLVLHRCLLTWHAVSETYMRALQIRVVPRGTARRSSRIMTVPGRNYLLTNLGPNMNTELLSRFRYPFPSLVSPFVEAMQQHTDTEWIDGELRDFVPGSVAEMYKRTRTAYMTAYWYPTATWDRMFPLCRLYLWSLYNDDICEQASADDLQRIRAASIAILRGQDRAATAGILLGDQLEKLRNELLQFIPEESVERFAAGLDRYFAGVQLEITYRDAHRFPTLADYLACREHSVMGHPFIDVIEVDSQVTLPACVHEHPAVQRLKSLAVRIIAWFNDFQSLAKDDVTQQDYYNLIKVVEHEFGMSRDEAFERAMSIHNSELDEFVRLQATLPDFGEWHDATADYIHRMSFMISGWRTIDSITERYRPYGHPEPHLLRDRGLAGGSI